MEFENLPLHAHDRKNVSSACISASGAQQAGALPCMRRMFAMPQNSNVNVFSRTFTLYSINKMITIKVSISGTRSSGHRSER